MRKNPYIKNLDNIVRWIGVYLPSFFENGKINKKNAIIECKNFFKNTGIGMQNFTLAQYYFWHHQNDFVELLIGFYSDKFEQIFNSNIPARTKLGKWKELTLNKKLLVDLEREIIHHIEDTNFRGRTRGIIRDYIGQTINQPKIKK